MKKNMLKNIMIFMSVIFAILILPNKVFAYGNSISPIYTGSNTLSAANVLLNKAYTGVGLSWTYSSNKNYVENNFIPNKLYLPYGNYYFCMISTSGYSSDCFVFPNKASLSLLTQRSFDGWVIKYDSNIVVKRFHIYQGQITTSPGMLDNITGNKYLSFGYGSDLTNPNVKIYTNILNEIPYFTYNGQANYTGGASDSKVYPTYLLNSTASAINVDDPMTYFNGTTLIFNSTNYVFNPVVYRNSFSSTSINDLYSINFGLTSLSQNNDSIKFRLQFGANDHNINNLPTLSMVNASITDINGIATSSYNFNDYFTLTYTCNQAFVGDSETTCDGVVKLINSLPSSSNGFLLNFVFNNLNNYYIHVFDNAFSNFYWNDTQTFLKDYTHYCFSSDYDKAIIRSKTFDNISSSMFLSKIFVTDPKYNLKIVSYDFNNSITKLDFLDFSNYYYDQDYLFYKFDINEVNSVFPVLYNNANSSEVCFYLNNNSYVQFYNSSTVQSNVVGIDYNLFNSHNSLVLNNSFSDKINNSFVENNNDTFISSFRVALLSFKDDIVLLLNNVTYFWNSLTLILQYFFIIIFMFGLVSFIIKFLI